MTVYFGECGERFGTPQQMIEEIKHLRSVMRQAQEFRFWFNSDGSPCDGFRFREIGNKLEEMLIKDGFDPRKAYGNPPK